MTLCLNMYQVIDKESLKELNTTNLGKLTTRQLFDFSPSSNSILQQLYYKSKTESAPIKVDKNIEDHIQILKFLHHINVCYKIDVKKGETLSYRENAVSNFYKFKTTHLYFNRNIENCSDFTLIISALGHLPYQEIIATRFLKRRLYENEGHAVSSTNSYTSNHMTVEKKALPSPYETQCRNYSKTGFHGRDHCIDKCVASLVWNTFKKVSLMSLVTQPTDSLQFNRISLKDKKNYDSFSKILTNCERIECRNSNCDDLETVTSTEAESISPNRTFEWQHRVSAKISFRITSRPSLPFVEFIIYVLGSISTWTGLSVIACNPVKLANRIHMTLKSRLHYRKRNPIEIEYQILRKVRRMLDAHQTRLHFLSYYAAQQERQQQKLP